MSVDCLRIGVEPEYVVPEPIYEVQGREARPVAVAVREAWRNIDAETTLRRSIH